MLLTPRINLRIQQHGHIKSPTLTIITRIVQVNVMSDHQFLHPIMPCEFLDSPEFESSRATTDDKFKVGKKNCVYLQKITFVFIITEKYSMGCVSLRQREKIQ
jgi:hypothetical protein